MRLLRKPRRLYNLPLLISRLRNLPTPLTPSLLLIPPKLLHNPLNLRPQIRTNKTLLPHHPATSPTIPPHRINRPLRPRRLQHDPNRILEAHGTMRRVGWEEEQ